MLRTLYNKGLNKMQQLTLHVLKYIYYSDYHLRIFKNWRSWGACWKCGSRQAVGFQSTVRLGAIMTRPSSVDLIGRSQTGYGVGCCSAVCPWEILNMLWASGHFIFLRLSAVLECFARPLPAAVHHPNKDENWIKAIPVVMVVLQTIRQNFPNSSQRAIGKCAWTIFNSDSIAK